MNGTFASTAAHRVGVFKPYIRVRQNGLLLLGQVRHIRCAPTLARVRQLPTPWVTIAKPSRVPGPRPVHAPRTSSSLMYSSCADTIRCKTAYFFVYRGPTNTMQVCVKDINIRFLMIRFQTRAATCASSSSCSWPAADMVGNCLTVAPVATMHSNKE